MFQLNVHMMPVSITC